MMGTNGTSGANGNGSAAATERRSAAPVAEGAREAFRRLTEFSDGQLRFVGLISVAIGIIVLIAMYA